jgi:hypothetical protein
MNENSRLGFDGSNPVDCGGAMVLVQDFAGAFVLFCPHSPMPPAGNSRL